MVQLAGKVIYSGYNCDCNTNTNILPPEPAHGLKRKHSCTARSEFEGTAKRRMVVKSGIIESEKVLMDIAQEISSKWEEVGIYLGLTSKEIRNELSSESGQSFSKKAFRMLLVWKEKVEDDSTYVTLAKALEAAGLNTCAKTYCYKDDIDRAED